MGHALVGGTEDAFREKWIDWIEWVDWVEPEPQSEPSLPEDPPHQSPAKQ